MADETGIPLTVVGGFLGSGKTTLINHVLTAGSGLRTAVLVNDFGAINVDAQLISSAGGEAIALTNGCICCSIGDDFTDSLIQVIESEPRPDWIVIEASGVSEPRKIAQVGLTDPALLLDGIIVMVDAESIRANAADPRLHDSILRQLSAADVLVVNKIDLITLSEKKAVRDWLATWNPDAWICETTNAAVPFEALTSLAVSSGSSRRERTSSPLAFEGIGPETRADPGAHEHTRLFSSWMFETDDIIDHGRLRDLLDHMPAEVIRAKGIVRTDRAPEMETVFQFAGKSRLIKVGGRKWQGHASRIVFISPDPDATFAELKKATQDLSACPE